MPDNPPFTPGGGTGASREVGVEAEHVRTARDFTGRGLDGHLCADVAVQLVSELITNSVRYSESAGPEGTIGVTVSGSPNRVKVEVREDGCVTWFLLGG